MTPEVQNVYDVARAAPCVVSVRITHAGGAHGADIVRCWFRGSLKNSTKQLQRGE